MNAAAELYRQLGIHAKAGASLTQLPISRVKAVLEGLGRADDADALLKAVGASVKVPSAPPLSFAIDGAYLDSLFFDNAHRKMRGIEPLPANRKELRLLCMSLRRRRMTWLEVATWLEKNHIPTVEGLRKWRRTSIAQRKGRRQTDHHDDNVPLKPDANAASDWQADTVAYILAELCPPSPSAPVRFGMTVTDLGAQIMFATDRKLPACIRQWMVDWLTGCDWLRGHVQIATDSDERAVVP